MSLSSTQRKTDATGSLPGWQPACKLSVRRPTHAAAEFGRMPDFCAELIRGAYSVC
jgi:hypothetical protein